jgi:hypothetical protein
MLSDAVCSLPALPLLHRVLAYIYFIGLHPQLRRRRGYGNTPFPLFTEEFSVLIALTSTKLNAQFNQQVFAPYKVNGPLAGQFRTAGTLSAIVFMSDIYPLTPIASQMDSA